MKGTDCTPEQIEAASQFLVIAKWSPDVARAECSREQVAQLLAWYGAMRFKAARDGEGGTLECPGILDVKPRAQQ